MPEKTCLIIIDALRYDHYHLLENILELGWVEQDNHFANAPMTEPSLFSILTGKYPQEHGVVAQAMQISGRFRKISNSFAMSPMLALNNFIESLQCGKWIEHLPKVEKIRNYDFVLLHLMDVHDYIYDDYAENARKKLQSHGVKIKDSNPGMKNQYLSKEEWHELYASTVVKLDELLFPYIEELWDKFRIIITADHGEHIKERIGGHAKLRLETLHVPLLMSFGEKVKGITEHIDLLKGLKSKDVSFAGTRHWAKQESVTNGRHMVVKDYDRGYGYFVDDSTCEPDETHKFLQKRLDEFSKNFEVNHVAMGRPWVERLKRDADVAMLKKWLEGWSV